MGVRTQVCILLEKNKCLNKKKIAQGYDLSNTEYGNYNQDNSSSSEDDEDENEDDYNVLFSGGIKDDIIKHTRAYQKINHFPDSFNLGRKDAMWKNYADLIDRMRDVFLQDGTIKKPKDPLPDDFNF